MDDAPTMLKVLQSDVLNLTPQQVGATPSGGSTGRTIPKRVKPRTLPFSFRICHGELRQVEAIMTRFRRLELDPARDIVV